MSRKNQSKIYFKNTYHEKNGDQIGDNKIYAISAYTLAEDDDNFYLTIPKTNQDLITGIEMYLSPISLVQMLEKTNLIIANEKQFAQLPQNLSYEKFISLTKDVPNQITPNLITPNQITPNQITPNQITPNQITPNQTIQKNSSQKKSNIKNNKSKIADLSKKYKLPR